MPQNIAGTTTARETARTNVTADCQLPAAKRHKKREEAFSASCAFLWLNLVIEAAIGNVFSFRVPAKR